MIINVYDIIVFVIALLPILVAVISARRTTFIHGIFAAYFFMILYVFALQYLTQLLTGLSAEVQSCFAYAESLFMYLLSPLFTIVETFTPENLHVTLNAEGYFAIPIVMFAIYFALWLVDTIIATIIRRHRKAKNRK